MNIFKLAFYFGSSSRHGHNNAGCVGLSANMNFMSISSLDRIQKKEEQWMKVGVSKCLGLKLFITDCKNRYRSDKQCKCFYTFWLYVCVALETIELMSHSAICVKSCVLG